MPPPAHVTVGTSHIHCTVLKHTLYHHKLRCVLYIAHSTGLNLQDAACGTNIPTHVDLPTGFQAATAALLPWS